MGTPRGGGPQGGRSPGRTHRGSGSRLDPAPRVHPRRAPEGRERARVDDDADIRRLHRPPLRVAGRHLRRFLRGWLHPGGLRRDGCAGTDAHARDQRSPHGFAGMLPRPVPRGLARGSPALARHRCGPAGLARRHERVPAPARRVLRGLEHVNNPRRAAGRGPAGGDLVRERPRRQGPRGNRRGRTAVERRGAGAVHARRGVERRGSGDAGHDRPAGGLPRSDGDPRGLTPDGPPANAARRAPQRVRWAHWARGGPAGHGRGHRVV